VAAAVVVALLVGALAPVGPLGAQDPTVTTAPIPPPAASIVVDVDTGAVVTASNDRQALPPASTTKLLTVLLADQQLDLDDEVAISATASIAPPRRIRLPAGTRWRVEDLMYAAILCSCNDASWALGQAAGGGTMAGFEARAAALATTLGLADGPVLRDPAGLDDDRSVRGGNLLSARDLAIIGRAYLARPELAAIAAAPEHRWVGGDGEPHDVTNLNRFLGAYEGAIGLKTGSTRRAGLTFVAAAEREGRTLLAVVLGSANHYADARALLDAGFLLSKAGEATGDVLPPVPAGLGAPETTTTTTTTSPSTSTAPPTRGEPTTGSEAAPAPSPTAAGPAVATDEGLPVDPVWLGAGGAVIAVGAGTVVLARRRTSRRGIDRRPVRERRRDRRRTPVG
jgi:D-alanyl-D-alanine carboxypeptidase (penicillin-binding protein 5/6)